MNIEKKPYKLSIWEDVPTYIVVWANGTEQEFSKENLPNFSKVPYKCKVISPFTAIRQDGGYLRAVSEMNENILSISGAEGSTTRIQVQTYLNNIDITNDNSIELQLGNIDNLHITGFDWALTGLCNSNSTTKKNDSISNYQKYCHDAYITINAETLTVKSQIYAFPEVIESAPGDSPKYADLEFIYIEEPADGIDRYLRYANRDNTLIKAPQYKVSNIEFTYTEGQGWFPSFLSSGAYTVDFFTISRYDQVYSIKYSFFKEREKAFLGSDSVNNQIKAFSPKFSQNINGANTLEFSIYYKYYDNLEEKELDNPLVNLLVNERKVKLFYDDEWYDFIIKDYKKDSKNHTITYTCTDAFINELSKTGFNIELDATQQNNMGNVPQLAAKAVTGTDWRAVGTNGEIVNESEIKFECMGQTEECYIDIELGSIWTSNNLQYQEWLDSPIQEYTPHILVKDLTYTEADGWSVEDNVDYYMKNNVCKMAELSDGTILESDYIRQTTDETLFKCTLSKSITAFRQNDFSDNSIPVSIPINQGDTIYVFYSVLTEASSLFQFLYLPNQTESQDGYLALLNENGVAKECPAYYITGVQFEYREALKLYAPDFIGKIRNNLTFRGERLVQQPESQYSNLFKRYVYKYLGNDNQIYYSFSENGYLTPAYVTDYVVNGRSFNSTTGWNKGALATNKEKASLDISLLNNEIEEPILHFDENAQPYLKMTFPNKYSCIMNEGIYTYLPVYKHFTKGQQMVLKFSAYQNGNKYNTDQLKFKVAAYTEENGIYTIDNKKVLFEFPEGNFPTEEVPWHFNYDELTIGEPKNSFLYLYCISTCKINLTNTQLKNLKLGLFIYTDNPNTYYLRDIQLFNYEPSNLISAYKPDNPPLSKNLKKLFQDRLDQINRRNSFQEILDDLKNKRDIVIAAIGREGGSVALSTQYQCTIETIKSFTDIFQIDNIYEAFKEYFNYDNNKYNIGINLYKISATDSETTITSYSDLKAYFTDENKNKKFGLIFTQSIFSFFIEYLYKKGRRSGTAYTTPFNNLCTAFYGLSPIEKVKWLTENYEVENIGKAELVRKQYQKTINDCNSIITTLNGKISKYQNELDNYNILAEITTITMENYNQSALYNIKEAEILAYQIAAIKNYPVLYGNPIPKIPGETLSYDLITKYYYYPAIYEQIQNQKVEDIEFAYEGSSRWIEARQVYSDSYEKIRSVEAKESSCYNILLQICETFECWARFTADRVINDAGEKTGEIKYDLHSYFKKLTLEEKNQQPDRNLKYFILDDNKNYTETGEISNFSENQDYYIKTYYYGQRKYVSFHKYTGNTNYSGFKYGINLNGITRNINSNNIISKLIVKNNSNTYAENGFCSIRDAQYNPSGENALYEFGYYVRQGLIDNDTLQEDLYGTSEGSLGYYLNVKDLNKKLAPYTEELVQITAEYSDANGTKQALIATCNELESTIERLKQALFEYSGEIFTYEQIIDPSFPEYGKGKYREQCEAIYSTMKSLEQKKLELADAKKRDAFYEERYNYLTQVTEDYNELKDRLGEEFLTKYSRFIQEGYWVDEEYLDPDLYYLDATKIIYNSSNPQLSYDISVIALDGIEEYKNYNFKIGDITYIEDIEYFGYTYKNNIKSPYQEKIIVSEISFYLDTPQQNTIKVQNYKPDFENLFQKMASTVAKMDLSSGAYDVASEVIKSDGTIAKDYIQNTFDQSDFVLSNVDDQSIVWDKNGITITDKTNVNFVVRLVSSGILLSQDGGDSWKTGITGSGINTAVLSAGKINTSEINLYSGESTSFRWDYTGLNAYFKQVSEIPGESTFDFGKFVRFDHFGIYGYDKSFDPNSTGEFLPTSLVQLNSNAGVRFSLTWDGLMLRTKSIAEMIPVEGSSPTTYTYTYGGIKIDPDNDFTAFDGDGKVRVQIGVIDKASATTSLKSSYGMRLYDSNQRETLTTTDNGKLWLYDTLIISKNRNDTFSRSTIGRMGGYIGWFGTNPSVPGPGVEPTFYEVINVKDSNGNDRFRLFDDGTLILSGKLILTGQAEIFTNKLYAVPDSQSGDKEAEGYLQISPYNLTIYGPRGTTRITNPERLKLGYNEAGDYSYIQFLTTSEEQTPEQQGLIKRYSNGLWLGNSNSLSQTGGFDVNSPVYGDTGLFLHLDEEEPSYSNVYIVYQGRAIPFNYGDVVGRFG